MLKFIQKSLVICSASLGLSGLACANDGWDLDWRGQPDLSSQKNQARWAQAQQGERDRQTREYEAWQDRLAAVRDKPLQYRPPHEDRSPAYIPAASYQVSDTSRSIAPSKRQNTDRSAMDRSATGGLPDMRPESETPYQRMQREAMNEAYGKPYGAL
jgi:hypothetical protein